MYFEETLGGVFPPEWEMTERVAVHACELTRKQLSDLMALRSSQLEAGLLVTAMSKTSAFELLLSKRFTGVTLRGGCGYTENKESSKESSNLSNPVVKNEPEIEQNSSVEITVSRPNPFDVSLSCVGADIF